MCCGCHEGVYGRFWGLSEALQRGLGGLFQPSGVGWGVGCGRREHSLVWNQETGGGGGPTGGVVARSPVQNPGSESGRSLGQRLGGEILRVPWPFGWSTVYLGPGPWDFSPGTAGALRKSALSTRGGLLKKEFLFFLKRLLGYWDDLFHSPCSNYFISVRVHFRTKPLK